MNPVIFIVLIYSLLLPGLAGGIWKKKTGVKFMPFLAGAVCFFLFANVLEGLLHALILSGTNSVSVAVLTRPLLYVLYGAFAAGIFEETGRLFGFRVLLKKHEGREISVAYGIGHGGMEVLLTLFAAYILYAVVLLGGSLGDPSTDAVFIAQAMSITGGTAAFAMIERLSAMMLHTGLSILMYSAVRTPGKKHLYPVSMLLHAASDIPAAMYQAGIITSILTVETMIFAFAAAVLFFAVKKIYIPLKETEEAE